jgi:hypothetical protein
MKMVSVARKLSTIEERREDQSYLFRRGDYRNRGHNIEKTVLGSSPDEDGFEAQYKNGAENKILFFGEETTGTELINPKTVLV